MPALNRPLDAILAACLSGDPAVVSAYLFGRVAADRPHRESGVDVGVLLDRRTCPQAADRIEARLPPSGNLAIRS